MECCLTYTFFLCIFFKLFKYFNKLALLTQEKHSVYIIYIHCQCVRMRSRARNSILVLTIMF